MSSIKTSHTISLMIISKGIKTWTKTSSQNRYFRHFLVPHLQRILGTDVSPNSEEPGKHSSEFSTLDRERRVRNGEELSEPEPLLPLKDCDI